MRVSGGLSTKILSGGGSGGAGGGALLAQPQNVKIAVNNNTPKTILYFINNRLIEFIGDSGIFLNEAFSKLQILKKLLTL